jgi:major membrane immunogen (membrane-anchored lipoprotein)
MTPNCRATYRAKQSLLEMQVAEHVRIMKDPTSVQAARTASFQALCAALVELQAAGRKVSGV